MLCDWPGKGQMNSERGHIKGRVRAKHMVELPFLSKKLKPKSFKEDFAAVPFQSISRKYWMLGLIKTLWKNIQI